MCEGRGRSAIETYRHHRRPPSAGGPTDPEQNYRRAWTTRALAFVLALAVSVAGAIAFQRGPTPRRWLDGLTAALSEQWGADVSIRSLSLTGWGRVTLHDVHVAGPVPLTARRVTAAFSVAEWVRNPSAPRTALRWIRVEDWEAAVSWDGWARDGTDPPPAWLDGLGAPWDRLFGVVFPSGPAGEAPRGAASSSQREGPPRDGADGARWLDRLLSVAGPEQKLEVYLEAGRVASPEGGPAFTVDGVVALGEGRLRVRNGYVSPAEGFSAANVSIGRLTVNGDLWPRPDLYAVATAETLETESPSSGTGSPAAANPGAVGFRAAEGEAWLTGTWARPDVWGTFVLRRPTFPWREADSSHLYALDEAVVQWGFRPGDPVRVLVHGARDGARLRMEGVVDAGGALDFAVVAKDVALPTDVPALARYDASGWVDVVGGLTGTWDAPVLEADVASDGGRLFGRPISGLQGRLRLTTDGADLDNVRIDEEEAQYFLDGHVSFSGGQPFDLVLRTDRGRAETLFAVLGWDVPVHSAWRGTIRFARPEAAVLAAGDVVLERGRAWGQPFDRVAGSFRYADGAFAVEDVTGRLGTGEFKAAGGSPASGEQPDWWTRPDVLTARWDGPGPYGPAPTDLWTVHVEAEDVPLQRLALWREHVPGVSGLIGGTAAVGSGKTPGGPLRVEADVVARDVAVGGVEFASAEGVVAWDGTALRTAGVQLRRRGGGAYDVAGYVEDPGRGGRLHLDVDGRGESVEGLLALTDWRLPLLAHGEPLRIRGTVTGNLGGPEAALRVESDTVYVAGRPTPLALDLLWRDGRVVVEDGILRKGNDASAGT